MKTVLDFLGNWINCVLDVEGNSSICKSRQSISHKCTAKSNSSNIELSRGWIPVHLNADLIFICVAALSQEEKNNGARSYMVIGFPGLWIIHEFIDCEKYGLNGPNTVLSRG